MNTQTTQSKYLSLDIEPELCCKLVMIALIEAKPAPRANVSAIAAPTFVAARPVDTTSEQSY